MKIAERKKNALDELRERWAGQEYVGLLLPPSVPAAMANIAAGLVASGPT